MEIFQDSITAQHGAQPEEQALWTPSGPTLPDILLEGDSLRVFVRTTPYGLTYDDVDPIQERHVAREPRQNRNDAIDSFYLK